MLVEKYNALNQERADERLKRYFKTKTLERLKGKGMFCGMDYTGIKRIRPIEYYSRYDHSKNVANTASKLSEELKVALTGAFHDVGTLSFAHVNSFKKKDATAQASDELKVESVLKQDEELLEYLHEDKIELEDVIHPEKYPLIDKDLPTLCLDRADGILATCLFWAHTHSIEEIEALYNMLAYFDNLDGMVVDNFNHRLKDFTGEMALVEHPKAEFEDFFKAINIYSKLQLTKEDRYFMELLGLALNYYEDIGIIQEEDLFHLSEQEIIDKIFDSKEKSVLEDILSLEEVHYSKPEDKGIVVVTKPKIRQSNPLCFNQMSLCEINDISGEFYQELNPLFKDICLTSKPITGDLSKDTVKKLAKYQKRK